MSHKNTTQKIVIASMMASLVCVATMVVKIPSPLNGYLNIGDCIVLLAGWLLSPAYGFLAAGIGSALADVFSGYLVYAPATFAIKGAMALIAYYGVKLLREKPGKLVARIASGAVAEIFMVGGYFLFEGIIYDGFIAVAVNIPANAIQGAVGLVLGCLLVTLFEKKRINLQ